METLKKNKNSIILLVILIAGFVYYKYFFKADEPLITAENSSSVQIIGQELISEINRLNALKRVGDSYKTLLTDQSFLSLNDIQVNVQSKPIGRSNPFLSTGQ
jgi:hypothetical protein